MMSEEIKITNADVEKMVAWVTDKMKPAQWYPVKSDMAYETLKYIIENENYYGLEFDEKELNVRKVTMPEGYERGKLSSGQ